MKERTTQCGKYHTRNKKIKRSVITIVTLAIVFSALLLPLNRNTPVVEAVGVGLIGGATTNSDYDNGILTIGIHGGSALSLDIAKDYYAQVQLPSSLGYLLELPNIREHIKLIYSRPAPLLGFIPIEGEIKGDNLIFDTTNNIVQGAVHIPINLSLAGVYRFTLEIDLEALKVNIPENKYEFKITVGDTQLDLDLLDFSQSMTTLEFNHDGEEEMEEEVPPVGNEETNATVTFLPSTTSPPIVDPTNPTEPYEPDPNDTTDPQDPPTDDIGPLTLDYVSSIDFGTQEIAGSKRIYQAATLRPFIQVTDFRNDNTGWAVTARLSEFEKVEPEGVANVKDTLPGAMLVFSNGTVVSPSNNAPPYAYDNIQLHPGGEANWVLWAEADTGGGIWVNRWYPSTENATSNDHVQLEIPAGAARIGNHQAAITWTLTSAPGQ